MGSHLGIGATAASAVIFTVLLISNLALFASSQSRADLYHQADAEDLVGDESKVLSGALAANLLLIAQGTLASQTFSCGNAMAAFGAEVFGRSDDLRVGFLNGSGIVEGLVSSGSADNLTLLRPFNGSVSGAVNLRLALVVSGHDPSSGVAFDKVEVHTVHLPARLESAASDCGASVSAITSFVRANHPSNCTSAVVDSLMANASALPASLARSDGFNFFLRYSLDPSKGCAVTFMTSISEPDIEGPGGAFTLSVRMGGSAIFG